MNVPEKQNENAWPTGPADVKLTKSSDARSRQSRFIVLKARVTSSLDGDLNATEADWLDLCLLTGCSLKSPEGSHITNKTGQQGQAERVLQLRNCKETVGKKVHDLCYRRTVRSLHIYNSYRYHRNVLVGYWQRILQTKQSLLKKHKSPLMNSPKNTYWTEPINVLIINNC
jgi:hypothetical protein